MSEKCLILLLHHEQLQIPLAVWGHQCFAKLCCLDLGTLVSYYSNRQGLLCCLIAVLLLLLMFLFYPRSLLNTFWQPRLKKRLVLKKMCIAKVILASVPNENMFSADELQACAAVHASVATSER